MSEKAGSYRMDSRWSLDYTMVVFLMASNERIRNQGPESGCCKLVMKPVPTDNFTAEFEAEVAGKSERNKKIATKPRRPSLDQMCTQQRSHAYVSRRGRHAQKAVSAQMQLRVPNGLEGKEQVKPVKLSITDTPASIVAVPYSTWFTTVITGTSALGPSDSGDPTEFVSPGLLDHRLHCQLR
ncbi:hypothetical protein PIB30_026469 [Stylosanthes scabra]|uniref:Uncharacterized protein n=1 Tax=Stylosanthes scabra TaxID=79078 RepID=A0ABU6W8V9_9FABA|nr:hypothetical protein [Stylosanthes scabra]